MNQPPPLYGRAISENEQIMAKALRVSLFGFLTFCTTRTLIKGILSGIYGPAPLVNVALARRQFCGHNREGGPIILLTHLLDQLRTSDIMYKRACRGGLKERCRFIFYFVSRGKGGKRSFAVSRESTFSALRRTTLKIIHRIRVLATV